MKVFISGASGLVGGNCLRYFKENKWEVVGSHLSFPTANTVYYNTLELSNPENFDIHTFEPDVIIHCGALTHVDYCEENVTESFEKTVQSTVNLTNIAKELNAKLVLISTDYVFDGTAGPYTETAIPNPLSVYGLHKLEAEQYVQNTTDHHLIIRVTNVYGDEIRNKNFVSRIIEQCQNDDNLSLRLPTDQYASPTNAWDIARALFVLCQEEHTGIYHIGSSDYMNRVTLALSILQYFPNATYQLSPETTVSLQQKAPRPLKGGFISEKFNASFPTIVLGTLDQYLNKKLKTPKPE